MHRRPHRPIAIELACGEIGGRSAERKPTPAPAAKHPKASGAGDLLDGLACAEGCQLRSVVLLGVAGGRHCDPQEDARNVVGHLDIGGVDVVVAEGSQRRAPEPWNPLSPITIPRPCLKGAGRATLDTTGMGECPSDRSLGGGYLL